MSRLKVHQVLVKETPKHIPCVVVVEIVHFTIKKSHVHPVDIQQPKLERVIFDFHVELIFKKLHVDNWAVKAQRRRTTGTGRMRSMKHIPRLFKNGFRTGTSSKKTPTAAQ